jgi:hypothetical protein
MIQHRSLWILCETWCGLIFTAPDTKEYLSELIEEGIKIEESLQGFSFFPVRLSRSRSKRCPTCSQMSTLSPPFSVPIFQEWQFIKAIFYLTYGSEEDQICLPAYLEELRAFTSGLAASLQSFT